MPWCPPVSTGYRIPESSETVMPRNARLRTQNPGRCALAEPRLVRPSTHHQAGGRGVSVVGSSNGSTSNDTRLVAALFVRGLGLVFAIAFASLLVQALSLYGPHGITPAVGHLALAREPFGSLAVMGVPSGL